MQEKLRYVTCCRQTGEDLPEEGDDGLWADAWRDWRRRKEEAQVNLRRPRQTHRRSHPARLNTNKFSKNQEWFYKVFRSLVTN